MEVTCPSRCQKGLKILGTPIGQPEFVRAELAKLVVKHQVLLDRIPSVNDLHSMALVDFLRCYPCLDFHPEQDQSQRGWLVAFIAPPPWEVRPSELLALKQLLVGPMLWP